MDIPQCPVCGQNALVERDRFGNDKIHYDQRLGIYFKRYRCSINGCKIKYKTGSNLVKDIKIREEFEISTE